MPLAEVCGHFVLGSVTSLPNHARHHKLVEIAHSCFGLEPSNRFHAIRIEKLTTNNNLFSANGLEKTSEFRDLVMTDNKSLFDVGAFRPSSPKPKGST